MKKADLILKNGIVYTMTEPWQVQAVAVSAGEIIYTGSNVGADELAGESTRVVDLEGRCVTPGFIDAHTHEVKYIINDESTMSFGGIEPDFKVYCEAFAEFVDTHESETIYFGKGLDISVLPDGKRSVGWLDEICPDKPVAITDTLEQTLLLNSCALEIIGQDRESAGYGNAEIYEKSANGEPVVYAKYFPRGEISDETFKKAFLKYQKHCNSCGITGIDIAGPTLHASHEWELFDEMQRAGELTLRINCSLRDPNNSYVSAEGAEECVCILESGQKYNSDWQKISQVKCYIDGLTEDRTAFVFEPYLPEEGQTEDSYGAMEFARKDLEDFLKVMNKAGYQVQIHAIGDAGVSNALDAIQASAEAGAGDCRNILAHIVMITDDDIKRMSELNVIGAMQPLWFYYGNMLSQLDEKTLGPERARKTYRIRDIVDAGIRVTGSVDYIGSPPQDDMRPLYGMETLVTNSSPYEEEKDDPAFVRDAKQTISRKEMLEIYSVNGAYQMKMEDKIGTVEVGKKADLVVLDKDIINCDAKDIARTEVCCTIVDGNVVWGKL